MKTYTIEIACDSWTIAITIARATVWECYQYVKRVYPQDARVVSIYTQL